MALKFAHAFGAHVVQFTTSESKVADAKRLGADEVVISKDAAAMKKQASSFDFILDTVSAPHDINPYLEAAEARRHLRAGRPARQAARHLSRQPHLQAPQLVRLDHRRHARNPGDARLLRREGNHLPTSRSSISSRSTRPSNACVKADVKYRFVIDMASLGA